MSRSIGDMLAHKVGVSDIPEVREYNINNIRPVALIVASDDVWEFMSNERVKSIVLNYTSNQNAKTCARDIVEQARQMWKRSSFAVDDVTCVVVFLRRNNLVYGTKL